MAAATRAVVAQRWQGAVRHSLQPPLAPGRGLKRPVASSPLVPRSRAARSQPGGRAAGPHAARSMRGALRQPYTARRAAPALARGAAPAAARHITVRRGATTCAAGASGAAMAQQWLTIDQDPASRTQVQDLISRGDAAALEELFGARLEFGTAGLRGKMGPGFSRMNVITVQQSTQGLCAYLESQEPGLKQKGVIIGHDARHHSREFAEIAAKVFLSRGVPVKLFSTITPTPFVAFGTAYLGAAAGVMVTASHNTKEYNGYKVYWGNGCQIIPPLDAGIASAIDANLALWDLSAVDLAAAAAAGQLSDALQQVSDAYFSRLRQRLHFADAAANSASAPVVYTPLHGVGLDAVQRAFKTFGLPPPIVVAQQANPDPEFSSLGSNPPNPEEGKGVWTLAYETAAVHKAAVVVANDPDADRLAAAEVTADGSYASFSGNDIGLLLADWVYTNSRAQNPDVPPAKIAMLSTAVSSKALAAMAAAEGFHFEETLTGFKWLGNVAARLEQQGYTVLFAYEEAIGFMFNALHKDKDGVSAAAAFAEMAASHARAGKSVRQHLAELFQRYGPRAYRSGYFIADPPSKAAGVFEDLRAGGKYPTSIAGVRVTGVRDMGVGLDTTTPDRKPTLPWAPGDLMITFYLEHGGFCVLRGSGTEPKLKYYLEVGGGAGGGAEAAADAVERAVAADLVRPAERGLGVRPA